MSKETLGHGVVGTSPHSRELRYGRKTAFLNWALAINVGIILGIIFGIIGHKMTGGNPHSSIRALLVALAVAAVLYGLVRQSAGLDERRHDEQ